MPPNNRCYHFCHCNHNQVNVEKMEVYWGAACCYNSYYLSFCLYDRGLLLFTYTLLLYFKSHCNRNKVVWWWVDLKANTIVGFCVSVCVFAKEWNTYIERKETIKSVWWSYKIKISIKYTIISNFLSYSVNLELLHLL